METINDRDDRDDRNDRDDRDVVEHFGQPSIKMWIVAFLFLALAISFPIFGPFGIVVALTLILGLVVWSVAAGAITWVTGGLIAILATGVWIIFHPIESVQQFTAQSYLQPRTATATRM